MSDDSLQIPHRPANRVLWSSIALAVVGALVAAAVIFWPTEDTTCGEGVTKAGEDCYGVTDGAYSFPGLDDISEKIEAENRRVEKEGGAYVTVAYLEAMSGGEADRGRDTIREAVTGAHLAQLDINRKGGARPRVRLLLASTGHGDTHASDVVEQLVSLRDEERLVAVAGLGQSNKHTVAAVDELRKAGMPTVGATVAADGFGSDRKGFYRVSFPTKDQAGAAARYLKKEQDADHGYRVQIVRGGKDGDDYNAQLYWGFRAAAERVGLKVDEEIVPYSSGSAAPQSNDLYGAAEKVCAPDPQPDAVYFAGRGRDLRLFIEAAGEAGRRCPVKVLSGSSAVGVYFDTAGKAHGAELKALSERWRASGIKAYYTAFTHPKIAAEVYGGKDRGPYGPFEERYRAVTGSSSAAALEDGQAMLGHDAVYTVAMAARRALRGSPEGVDAMAVRGQLEQTQGLFTVRGVSGKIAFDPDTGEPTGRPMALVELGAPEEGGGAVGRYRFVEPLRP
ncbi:hypothetical protein [Streptomyces sp. NBC_01304]|uniref:hypothetical protein n=1 Tax=Streptomyces sp. NBC_01304 TaxID=2903818 RepID=UPI002E0E1606|nr:hypothetical protein OG430_13285 [Streptomyces sp. NBC_01304]